MGTVVGGGVLHLPPICASVSSLHTAHYLHSALDKLDRREHQCCGDASKTTGEALFPHRQLCTTRPAATHSSVTSWAVSTHRSPM